MRPEAIRFCAGASECAGHTTPHVFIISYVCRCEPGFGGKFCDQPTVNLIDDIRIFSKILWDIVQPLDTDFCNTHMTKCVNGKAVIRSKELICKNN